MSKYFVLDAQHNTVPCDLMTWAHWFEDLEARRVASTKVGDAQVSTVFLGMDHQYGEGPPLLFETMIFGGPHDEDQERCSTWNEALAQHEAMCARAEIGAKE